MSINAEVEGKSADRFRAYASAKMLRSANGNDYAKYAAEGKALPAGAKIRYNVDEIAFEGDVTGDKVTIEAGDKTITHVAFYKGPVETEVVVGSAMDINASGTIEIEFVEPPPSDNIVDEAAIVDE